MFAALAALILNAAVVPAVQAAQSAAVDSLVAAARAAARNDAHARAIDLYRNAIEKDPERHLDLAFPLARELTWAGRFDEAELELAFHLERRPKDRDVRLHRALNFSWAGALDRAIAEYGALRHDDPGDLDAALGGARVLSWAGRLWEAERAYAEIAAAHPDAVAAELGRAQALNWAGRSRAALRVYDHILRAAPDNAEAFEGKLLAERWIGRPDRALGAITARGDAAPGSAKALEASIRRDLAPRSGTYGDWFDDSQDFRLWSVREEVTLHPVPLVRVAPWVSFRHEQRPGEFDIDETMVGAGAGWRLSTGLSAAGTISWIPNPEVDPEAPDAAGDLSLLIEPDDVLKVTLAASRTLYTVLNRFTAKPRADRLRGDAVGFAASRKLDTRSSLAVNYDYSTYDLAGDDAARFRHNGRARLRTEIRSGRPKVWLEGGYQHIDFNGWAPIGVWTPDRFQSVQFAVDSEWSFAPGWSFSGGLQGGTQREQQKNADGILAGSWDAFGGFTARLSGRAGGFDLYAGGGHANASFETGRGYRRTYLYTGITRGF